MKQGGPPPKQSRRAKTALDSRSFKDAAIYLYRRADYKKPTWFCRVKVQNGTGYISVSTGTTNEHEAYKFADNLYTDTVPQRTKSKAVLSKQIAKAITEYLKTPIQAKSRKLSAKFRSQFLTRSIPYFAEYRFSDLTKPMLADFLEWTSERSRTGVLSPNTIKRYATDFKLFLNWCQDKGYLQDRPSFPRLRSSPNRRPHFNQGDWQNLECFIPKFLLVEDKIILRHRTMLANYVLILCKTGIRIGEARTLKWRDIREVQRATKQTADVAITLYVTGKTGPREVVARSADVKANFSAIHQMRTQELGGPPTKDDYVFCNSEGSPIQSFKTSFGSLLKGANVEKDSHGNPRTLYSLRHTYATFCLQDGVHHFILARNMGTSTAMLEKHYGHTSNVASATELTKAGTFNADEKAKTVDWL